MSLHCRGSVCGRAPGVPARRRQLIIPTATSGAVMTRPSNEAAVRHVTVSPRDDSVELIPASSGLDFIDLVGMDETMVMDRLQDAVTYRVLVGHCAPKQPARSPAFNIKQLKLYRDNVTRNLAPTVARGFANAARAAGHNISPTTAASPPVQPTRQPRSSAPTDLQSGGAPPPTSPSTPHQQAWAAATPASSTVSVAIAAAAAAAAAAVEDGFAASPPRHRVPSLRPVTITAAAATATTNTALASGPATCYSHAHRGPQSALVGHGAVAALALEGSPGSGGGGPGPHTGGRLAGSLHATSTSGGDWQTGSTSSPTASDRVMDFEGRRRGSRGAGRGPFQSTAAGRQAGGGGGGGGGPAWI